MPLQLLRLAEREGVIVEYWDLKDPLEAIYWYEAGRATIGLSESLLNNRAHYRTVFAEELGHHFTTARDCFPDTYFHYRDRVNISREECRALKWAATHLISEDRLYLAFQKNVHEPWRLASYFGVDESLVVFRLRLLRIQSKERRLK